MQLKWVIGAGAILMAVAIGTTLNFEESVAYFYVPKEVSAKADDLRGKNIRVGAMVKKGTVDWQPKKLSLNFVITDYDGHEFKVAHSGIKPDMFKEGQGVVVEGRLNDKNEIVSRTLMVKHSEDIKNLNQAIPKKKSSYKKVFSKTKYDRPKSKLGLVFDHKSTKPETGTESSTLFRI